MALDRPLKNILVLGATGNIGIPIINALSVHLANYTITATTRDASKVAPGTFPPGVKLLSSDLSATSLTPILKTTDAIISCVAVPVLPHQKSLIDLAISCGVARFIPSEFGINTSHPLARSILPLIHAKIDTQAYLLEKAAEGKISYTTIFNGAFFDWFFRFPDAMGWDVEGARATIYDGGEVEYEVTSVERIGEAVAEALAPDHAAMTRDRNVFVNSFTLTQKRLLPVLERAVGRKFDVKYDTVKGLKERTTRRCEEAGLEGGEKLEPEIAAYLLEACLDGEGKLNLYSKDPSIGDLWNERLGLREENLGEAVEEVIKAGKRTGLPEGMG